MVQVQTIKNFFFYNVCLIQIITYDNIVYYTSSLFAMDVISFHNIVICVNQLDQAV